MTTWIIKSVTVDPVRALELFRTSGSRDTPLGSKMRTAGASTKKL